MSCCICAIQIGANNGSDFGFMSAFRADNSLIATFNSFLLTTNVVQTLAIGSGLGDIAYIIAGGVGGDTVGLDNMSFVDNPVIPPLPVIPLPAAVWMAIPLLGGLGISRFVKRRRKA